LLLLIERLLHRNKTEAQALRISKDTTPQTSGLPPTAAKAVPLTTRDQQLTLGPMRVTEAASRSSPNTRTRAAATGSRAVAAMEEIVTAALVEIAATEEDRCVVAGAGIEMVEADDTVPTRL